MDCGESVGVQVASEDGLDAKCQFEDLPPEPDVGEEDEDLADDDVDIDEPNRSSSLRDNLVASGRNGWGKAGTWNERYSPDQNGRKPNAVRPRDTSTKPPATQVTISCHERPDSKSRRRYDWQVAAHHLIPGNASLKQSDLYQCFMKKGGGVEVGDATFKLRSNIGYNVNGNHNGMWLPGSYAIRKTKVPTGTNETLGATWGELDLRWRLAYIQAVVAEANAQFHDYHVDYNENVLAALDVIAQVMVVHYANCQDCQAKANGECDPPYRLKSRLYALSKHLRDKLRIRSVNPRSPWLTSDEYRKLLGDSILPR